MPDHMLDGLRVVEYADERAEYVGLVLAGLGAEVIKVEPPQGSPSRRIGPFYQDQQDPERSLFFWQYNRGKRSVAMDLAGEKAQAEFWSLLRSADVFLDSSERGELDGHGITVERLRSEHPELIIARLSAFGDEGPWAGYRGSDLIHLALGGQVMNCGYDPIPSGEYDLAPIAPQMWHSYHVAGENMLMAILAALYHRGRTGQGQYLSGAIHEAMSKNTEVDLMSWVMRRAPVHRQTCRHAAESVTPIPTIAQTKDGRWYMVQLTGRTGGPELLEFLERFDMAADLADLQEEAPLNGRRIPGTAPVDEVATHTAEVVARLIRKYSYARFPWKEAQDAGLMFSPLRRPEENLLDDHWHRRGTYSEIQHPEHGRSFSYVTSKWLSSETEWSPGRRAPLLDEDRTAILERIVERPAPIAPSPEAPKPVAPTGRPLPLAGVRVLDFGWFLASAGGTRFLAGMGAECFKVEWAAYPDTRLAAMAPIGGREARRRATAPLPGVEDSDMGGAFNNKNSGKRGISLNVRHPKGLEIAKKLVAICDIVAEGFSPGVLDRWGLGYDVLRSIRPDVIYAQQSGMGAVGTYGRFRSIGPIAASLAGLSEMSGLPEPAMPAGWGYSYLDWIGAYSFAASMLAALNYRQRTGKGQRIDASQTETGLFVGGTAVLDRSANGRSYRRTGNRSPHLPAAPHGIYRCAGTDRWIAIACFDDADWRAVAAEAGRPEWLQDERFATLAARIAHQDQLDDLLNEWTRGLDRYELMHALQRRGVAAGVCQTTEDRVDADPQLASLAWLTEVTGTKIGTWPVAELSVKMSETPSHIGGPVGRGAPIYGEDNEYVYGELLGMSTREIAQLAEDGVI